MSSEESARENAPAVKAVGSEPYHKDRLGDCNTSTSNNPLIWVVIAFGFCGRYKLVWFATTNSQLSLVRGWMCVS